jgi:Flp pilus assembly protein TadG
MEHKELLPIKTSVAGHVSRTCQFEVRPPIRPTRRRNGSAVVEFALVSPLMFLFMLAAFDFGLYTYAFIAVQNGARAAALRNSGGLDSASDSASACAIVLEELRGLPNTTSASACDGNPISVNSTLLCGSSCSSTASSADGNPATAVTVTYAVPPVFQFRLSGANTITRSAQMRIRSLQ